MTVIDEIISNKKILLEKSKNKKSLQEIKKEAVNHISTKDEKFRFQQELKDDESKLICEYKVASPSKGKISNLTVEDVVGIYDNSPVDMISILTEESYFGSNLKNFQKAQEITNKPLLRKDFVIDEYMIYEAALNDASCILLIEGICPDMEGYLNITHELQMDAIVECHSKEDIENVERYNPPIIGINNRNLQTLTTDLDTTRNLKEYVPNYMISESGVNTAEDAKLLKNYGADAILIGTSVLKNNNQKEIKEYIIELKNSLK